MHSASLELMVFMFFTILALPSSAPPLHPQPPKKSRFRASRDGNAKDPELAPPSAKHGPELPDLDPEEMLDSEFELCTF